MMPVVLFLGGWACGFMAGREWQKLRLSQKGPTAAGHRRLGGLICHGCHCIRVDDLEAWLKQIGSLDPAASGMHPDTCRRLAGQIERIDALYHER